MRRHQACCPGYLHQMQRIDNSPRSPRRNPMHSLRKFQVRIHPRRRRNEPRPQMRARLLSILPPACQYPRCRQRRHADRERNHYLSVLVEICRIALSISIDVWPVRILWVRPEIIRLRKKVVRPTRTQWRRKCRDRYWRQIRIFFRGLQNPRPVCCLYKAVRCPLLSRAFAPGNVRQRCACIPSKTPCDSR